MAAGRLIFPGLMPAVDADGDRIPGAKAYFYADLTSTLAPTYTDASLTVQTANPVVADAVGTWPAMWADTASLFTVALTDADGVPIPGAAWSGVSAAIDATLASLSLALAAQIAAQNAEIGAEAALAQAQALLADVTGAPFDGHSTANLSIGTGLKIFPITEAGTLYQQGQTLVAAKTGAAKNQMTGPIVAETTDPVTGKQTITLDIPAGGHAEPDGVGPYNTWTLSLSAAGGVVSVAGLTGAILAAALKAALGIASSDITDFITAVDDEAVALATVL